jgi:5-methylcytosine-specific restriction enzyme subunit McrC
MSEVIYEYSEVKDEHLKNFIIDTASLHSYFSFEWNILKSKQFCGILNFDSKDYYLLPKIAGDKKEQNLNIFIYMLMYVYDIKLKNEDLASCENHQNTILEVFIQLFAKNLFKQFQAGIYKEYITLQDNLPTLRGKYLINENLKYNHVTSKIYCEYDEFSPDNTLNRFFLYAIKTLQRYAKDKKLLKQCELILDEVEYMNFDIEKLDIHFNRLNARFKDSFEFALLLLKKSVPIFQEGKKSFAFLFDMNQLFERFVAKMINEVYDDVEVPRHPKDFNALHLKPDIIVKSKNLIIDCKYKVIDTNKEAHRDDRYQMYVYANNFEDIDATMLLYPKHFNYNEDVYKKLALGVNDKKVTLWMRSLDLKFDGKYEEFLEVMEKRVKEI